MRTSWVAARRVAEPRFLVLGGGEHTGSDIARGDDGKRAVFVGALAPCSHVDGVDGDEVSYRDEASLRGGGSECEPRLESCSRLVVDEVRSCQSPVVAPHGGGGGSPLLSVSFSPIHLRGVSTDPLDSSSA